MADFRGGPTVENFQKEMLLKVDFLDKLDNSEQKKIVLEVDFQKNVSIIDLRVFSQISKKLTFLFIGDRLIPPGFVKFSEIERGIFSGFWLRIKIDQFRAVLRSGIQCHIDTFF